MTIKTKTSVRLLSLLLALLLMFGTSLGAVSAATNLTGNMQVYIYTDHLLIFNGNDINFSCRYVNDVKGGTPDYTKPAYCIGYGENYPSDRLWTTYDITRSKYWSNLSQDAQDGIKYATIYGWGNQNETEPGVYRIPASGGTMDLGAYTSVDARYAATQLIIWEFQLGYRSFSGNASTYGRNNTWIYDHFAVSKYAGVKQAYDYIAKMVYNHKSRPSFTSEDQATTKTIELKWNAAQGKYVGTTTVTDADKELYSQFTFTKPNGISMSISGNTLTVTGSKYYNSATVSGYKTITKNSKGNAILCLEAGDKQAMVYGFADDPVNAYFKIAMDAPSGLEFSKSDAATGAALDGCTFAIGTKLTDGSIADADKISLIKLADGSYRAAQSGESGITEFTTSNGTARIDGLPGGTYYIQELTADSLHEVNKEILTVNIGEGEYAHAEMENNPSSGYAYVIKLEGDGESKFLPEVDVELNGDEITVEATFEIHRADNDEPVATVKSGRLGISTPVKLLAGVEYYIKEVAADGYIVDDDPHYFTVNAGETLCYLAYNKRQMGQIAIYKFDGDTAERIAGTTYTVTAAEDIYAKMVGGSGSKKLVSKGEVVDTITTDEEGNAITKPLYLGTYEIRETKAAPGYVADKTVYTRTLSYNGEVATVYAREVFSNQMQRGRLSIEKIGEVLTGFNTYDRDGYTLNSPIYNEARIGGAVYTITAAEDITTPDGTVPAGTVVDTITTDADSAVLSTELFCGKYNVREISVPLGYKLDTQTHTVDIEYDGQTVYLDTKSVTLYDDRQSIELDVTKEIEGGATDEYAYVKFGLYANADVKNINGDTVLTAGSLIDVAGAASDGKIQFTADLPVGSQFYIKELATSPNLVLDTTEYRFSTEVDATDMLDGVIHIVINSGDPIVNSFDYGYVSVSKQGEVLTGFDSNNKPVYEQKFVGGAVYNIIAVSEIRTPTSKIAPGTVVETLTTSDTGAVTSGKLYVGSYVIKEKSAPFGFVLDNTEYPVTIEADNVLDVTPKAVSVHEDRVRVQLDVTKLIEGGNTGLLKNITFGLYSAEDITGADGSVLLPKDSLIETAGIASDGKIQFKADLPMGWHYYIKELTTAPSLVLDTNKYTFDTTDDADAIDGVIHRTVNGGVISNGFNYGYLSLEKRGEVLTGFAKKTVGGRTIYTPVYEQKFVGGAVYDIIAAENIITPSGTTARGTVVETLTTSDTGAVMSGKLYVGKYTVREKKAPFGFVLDSTEYPVTIEANNVLNLEPKLAAVLENRVRVQLDVTKLIEGGNTGLLKNITFGLYSAEDINGADGSVLLPKDSLIETVGVASDGKIQFTADLPMGWHYYIKELTTAPSLVLDTNKYTFDTTDDADATDGVIHRTVNGGTITNVFDYGCLALEKLGEVLTGFTQKTVGDRTVNVPVYEQKFVGGAVYDIIAAENIITPSGIIARGTVVETLTTSDTGAVMSGKLYVGSYIVKEKSAPFGFVLDSTEYPVTIAADNTIELSPVTVTTKDVRIKVELNVQKLIEGGNEDLLEYVTFGLFSDEDIMSTDGDLLLAKDNLIEVAGVAADGKIQFTADLPIGFGFYIMELTTAPCLVLDTNKYRFNTANAMGSSSTKYEISHSDIVEYVYGGSDEGDSGAIDGGATVPEVNNGDPIVNEVIKGTISVVKTDSETSAPISGVEFEVRDAEGNVVAVLITDENGRAQTEPLPYGTYTVVETKTGAHYVLDETVYTIEITENLKDNEISVSNTREYKLTVKKVDSATGAALSGCTVGLFDSDGNELARAVTGADGLAVFEGLASAEYVVKELAAPAGYDIDATAHTVTIGADTADDDCVVSFELKDDRIDDSPKTGDTNAPIAAGVSAILATLLLCALLPRRRKVTH